MRTAVSKCLSLLGLFASINTFAQKNSEPGYIIRPNGDTVHGFVSMDDRARSPRMINFKERTSVALQTFSPLQIKGFGTATKTFIGAVIKVDDKIPGNDQFNYERETRYRTDTVFMETLVGGNKSLHYYNDRESKEHFYIKDDLGYTLLLYYRYFKDTMGARQVIPHKRYVPQLASYLNCQDLKNDLFVLEYKEKPLINLFKKYYASCGKEENSFSRQPHKLKLTSGVIGGVSITSLSFNFNGGNNYRYLTQPNFPSSTNFAGGVFFNITFPKNSGRWTVANELMYTSYKSSVIFRDSANMDSYTINDLTLGYSQIRMNNMLRLSLPVGTSSLFFNLGITNAYAVSETNTNEQESHRLSTTEKFSKKALEEARKYSQGIIAGAGVSFSKLGLQARYEISNGMSGITALTSRDNKIYFLLSYQF